MVFPTVLPGQPAKCLLRDRFYFHTVLQSLQHGVPSRCPGEGLKRKTRKRIPHHKNDLGQRSSTFILLSTFLLKTCSHSSQLFLVVCRTCWSYQRNCPTVHRLIKSAATSTSSSKPSTGVTRMRLYTEVWSLSLFIYVSTSMSLSLRLSKSHTKPGLLSCFYVMFHNSGLAFVCLSLPDIKPENLLISSEDVLKLCDFGECLGFSFCFFTAAILSR